MMSDTLEQPTLLSELTALAVKNLVLRIMLSEHGGYAHFVGELMVGTEGDKKPLLFGHARIEIWRRDVISVDAFSLLRLGDIHRIERQLQPSTAHWFTRATSENYRLWLKRDPIVAVHTVTGEAATRVHHINHFAPQLAVFMGVFASHLLMASDQAQKGTDLLRRPDHDLYALVTELMAHRFSRFLAHLP